MGHLDWIVLTLTVGFIVLYGIWQNRSHKNIKDYLKGGNLANWWTVGLSVMATQASAITFMSTPGQAFHEGMGFVQFYFGLPIAMLIICIFFIPVYNRLKVYTVYEFLETRFDLKTRTLTALLFILQRGLAAGITIYAPSIILNVVLGWDLNILVLIVGALVISYTLIGGTKAVSITQKQQMFIIFLGMFVAFVYLIRSLPDGIDFNRALMIAGISGKLEVIDFTLDLENRYTFWTGLIGGTFLALSYFGTDQSQAQRYLSGRSTKQSQMGLLMNGLLKVPMQFFILLVGVFVFLLYQFQYAPIHFNPQNMERVQNSELASDFEELKKSNQQTQQNIRELLLQPDITTNASLQNDLHDLHQQELGQREETRNLIKRIDPSSETNDKDYVFISYILGYLPKGLIGLLIAVIFCAAMSSTASEINALSATATVDLYRRNVPNKSQRHYLGASKWFTLLWGLVAIGFASIGNLFENLIQLVNIIGSLFYGTILGIFLIAFFIKRIGAKSVFMAAILSEIVVLIIYYMDIISYLWLNVIGSLLCIMLSYAIQLLIVRPHRNQEK